MTGKTDEDKNTTGLIHLVGDVGPRRIEYGEKPETLFEACRSKLQEADIRFCQLERVLSERGSRQIYTPSTWYARVHPDNIRALTFAGFTVVSIAGNHNADWGFEPLIDTIKLLKENGIYPVGAGQDIAEARKPVFIDCKGTKVAFLAYCSILPPGSAAAAGKPGLAPIEVSTYYEPTSLFQPGMPPKIITIPKAEHVSAMVEDIRKAKNTADIVIVSLHFGIPWIHGVLAMYQPEVAHAAIDAGADLIFGHHAHLIKGIEVYKGKVIFYSAGGFAQETPHHQKLGDELTGTSLFRIKEYGVRTEDDPKWARYMGPVERRYSMIARCKIVSKKVEQVSFLPVYVNHLAEPQVLTRDDPRFDVVVNYVKPLATELGTKLIVDGDEVVISAPE